MKYATHPHGITSAQWSARSRRSTIHLQNRFHAFLRKPRLPGSGSWQRSLQGRPLAADPSAHENDRGNYGYQHDSEQHGVLDERRALFVLAKFCESTNKFTHQFTPPLINLKLRIMPNGAETLRATIELNLR